MLNWRRIAAIAVGKLLIWLSRSAGQQGTNLPGRVANIIYPPLLADLAGNTTKDIFIITGTNGKTTTSNMIAAIIRDMDFTLVHNQAGANMIPGITTAFINQTNWTGRRRQDYALLETDEANVAPLLTRLKPRFILITNFFRDQLDRYGELDKIINAIAAAVAGTDIELILNADDPLESHWPSLTGLHCHYYGFDQSSYDSREGAESREGRYCMICGHELQYLYYHYAQLGRFLCPNCGHHNQETEYIATDLQLEEEIRFEMNGLHIESPYQGFYNAYNVLAAASLASAAGFDKQVIQTSLAQLRPSAGRAESFCVNGKQVILMLVKNPTGLDQGLTVLNRDVKDKNIFIALNDNAADGRDISWIWDAEVETLAQHQGRIEWVICSGLRSGDMALRMKYAGLPTEKIIIQPELRTALKQAINLKSQICYVLCTYTALFNCRKILASMQD